VSNGNQDVTVFRELLRVSRLEDTVEDGKDMRKSLRIHSEF